MDVTCDATARSTAFAPLRMRPDHRTPAIPRDPRLRLLLTAIRRQEAQITQHSRRVQQLALAFGNRLAVAQDTSGWLGTAAVLHDLGKFLVPAELLTKPGPLTRRERDLLREHAQLSEWLCDGLPWLHVVRPLVWGHHERLDGSGYPDGLAGSQIPLLTQILQLADVSDALLSSRPYRAALSLDQTASILDTEAQRGWRDRTLTDVCCTVLDHLFPCRPAAPSPPSHTGGVVCLTSPPDALEARFAHQ